ncbi:DUF1391 family protein [Salmonella enterica]|nr:DUF1391 family protein [Salmonella enterica]
MLTNLNHEALTNLAGQRVTAMTFTRSKTFKTEAGAQRWLTRNHCE